MGSFQSCDECVRARRTGQIAYATLSNVDPEKNYRKECCKCSFRKGVRDAMEDPVICANILCATEYLRRRVANEEKMKRKEEYDKVLKIDVIKKPVVLREYTPPQYTPEEEDALRQFIGDGSEFIGVYTSEESKDAVCACCERPVHQGRCDWQ